MKKKVNLVIAGLVLAGLAVFLAAEGAEAFCVYNNTDVHDALGISRRPVVEALQKEGGGFYKRIGSSERGCCNWQEKSCNRGGKIDSIVKIDVYYKQGMILSETVYICKDFPIQAGGWLTVEGSKGNYKCVRHDY